MEDDAKSLLVDSLAALKEGNATASLAAANRALAGLLPLASGAPDVAPLLARAFHRKAAALCALGDPVEAVRVYRTALSSCPEAREQLGAATRLTLDTLPASWHAAYWAARVESGQAPAAFSSRDGRRLKGIPPDTRLSPQALRMALDSVLQGKEDVAEEAANLVCDAWAAGKREPGRADLAFMRGHAYLASGDSAQALRDARGAVVYGPRDPGAAPAGAAAGEDGDVPRPGEGWAQGSPWLAAALGSLWPAALALLSSAYEATGDNVRAALLASLALERGGAGEPCDAHAQALERLCRRVPEACAAALSTGGSAALVDLLSRAHTQAQPEVLRRRPKYYYYYEWMRQRILQQYPSLPEPVMDKLLTVEANELDLVLQYPQATRQMVDNLLEIHDAQGVDFLETYRVPLLSWEEVKALKGPDTVGLALGSSEGPPTPPLLPASSRAQGSPMVPVAAAGDKHVTFLTEEPVTSSSPSPPGLLADLD